jgi:hypothetical protein
MWIDDRCFGRTGYLYLLRLGIRDDVTHLGFSRLRTTVIDHKR